MKKIFLIVLMCLPIAAMAQNKVAVYVTSGGSTEVDENAKKIVGCEMVAAIVKTKQYKAVERTADFLSQISKEQNYQRSGKVDDNQISELGKQFGVNYVCVANIMPYKNTYYIQARILDVETATVLSLARVTTSLNSINEVMSSVRQLSRQLMEGIRE